MKEDPWGAQRASQQIQMDQPQIRHGVHIVDENDVHAAAGESQDQSIGHGTHDILAHVHARAEKLPAGKAGIDLLHLG